MQTMNLQRSAGLIAAEHGRVARPRHSRTLRAVATETAPSEQKARKAAPLQKGGSLTGEQAFGKDAADSTKLAASPALVSTGPVLTLTEDGKFSDYRWSNGRWDMTKFQNGAGLMDWESWEKVMDAEMGRRKLLEDNPIASTNEDPVLFDTSEIPWWAWVRKFHLPEAEKLNGRAAMVGYALAFVVDSLSGAGLVDQQNSFLGKLLLHATVFAILIFRTSASVPQIKNLIDEATFYDKQWAATWDGQPRPNETEQ
ncbi:hypothetical protein WJX72_000206 [[Myrmecia] bisecta]|uniref:Uncharacterized protein n=1 Tax=[Myrmecia] bisecta TaxID=41462 RepID=A0AAW1PWB5_9CHLO